VAERVFLHIGLPKTGTTYLQGVVWQNKDALATKGLLVPGRNHRRHLLASLDIREDPTLANRPGDVSAPWQELVDEANAWAGDVLITHEFFGAAAPEQVRRVLDSFPDGEVHVIVTGRAMVDLGISRWQEWVKNGGAAGIDAYPRRADYDPTDAWGWGSFDLAEVLERWGSVVSHERIHVLPMASRGADPAELWGRLRSVLGIDGEGITPPERPANTTLGVVETELLRRITPHMKGFKSAPDRGNWIRGYLAEPRVLGSGNERFRPGEEKLRELQERGERARQLLAEGGYDVVGDPALLTPGDVSGLRHPSEVSDAEMLDAATRAIAVLMGDVRALTQEKRGPRESQNSRDLRVRVQAVARKLASRLNRGHSS
jgi:hypothetical protein